MQNKIAQISQYPVVQGLQHKFGMFLLPLKPYNTSSNLIFLKQRKNAWMLKMDKLWQMVNIYENLKGKNGFFTTRSPFVSKMFALDANELASFNSLILKT